MELVVVGELVVLVSTIVLQWAGAKDDGVPSSQASVQMLDPIEMFDQLYIKGGLP
jgi:hypothetical protein